MINQRIGLALGGGGARGIAHLGVLQHFESLHLGPDVLAGTSAGAIVASLYAFGVPLKTISEELQKIRPASFSGLQLNELGFFLNTDLEKMLTNLLPESALIENSPNPLAIHTTDIETGEAVTLTKGPVVDAVLASCCVPGIYIPKKIHGKTLVDGGLTENVPLSGLKKLNAKILIAVNLNGNDKYRRPESVFDILSNSLDIAIDGQTKKQLKEADITISMDLTSFSRFQVEKPDELFMRGQDAAEKALKSSRSIKMKYQVSKWRHRIENLTPLKIPNVLRRNN